jgi:5,6-dimethylbenzimidazole synthase
VPLKRFKRLEIATLTTENSDTLAATITEYFLILTDRNERDPVRFMNNDSNLQKPTFKKFSEAERATLEQIMHLRRDVRGNRFVDEPLEEVDLQRIIEAGLMAPSVGFSQPWRFVVIENQATKNQVADSFEIENNKAKDLFKDEKQRAYQQLKLEGIKDSAVNVAVFYQRSDAPVLGQTSMIEMGQYSVVCAIQNMWLMARALNIGLGWVSILDAKKVEKIVSADENQQLVAYLCIGPVDTFYDKPELETLGWDKKKAFDEVVFSEKLNK